MNLKKIFYLLIILVQTGCHTGKHIPDQALPSTENNTFYARYLFKDTTGIAYYECEDFVATALDNYSISKMDINTRNFLDCKKATTINPHDPSSIDTIYTYSSPNNKIQVYRVKNEDFVITFDITDPRLSLNNKICTGMARTEFAKKFHITDSVANHVLIRNTEATIKFLFHFDNSILKRISSYIYYD